MNKKISIIIPIYNGEKYLERCINSLLNQTHKNIEIILVNDGSSDNTDKLCKKMQTLDERIIYIKQKNSGVSSARNKGIEKSTGEYICFVDCDDWVDKKYCEILLKGMKKNTQLSVIGYKKYENYDSNNIKNFDQTIEINQNKAFEAIFTDKNFFGFPWNKLYKKEIIDKLGKRPFNTNIHICEDTLFNAKYLVECKKISYNQTPLYSYFLNDEGVTKSKVFNSKKLTVFDSLDEIEKIYLNYSPNNLTHLYKFYLYNYYLMHLFIKQTKTNIKLNKVKIKRIYKFLMKSKQVKLPDKIKISIKYHFPKLNNIIFNIRNK